MDGFILTKQIETLIQDIYSLFKDETIVDMSEERLKDFGLDLSSIIERRLSEIRDDTKNPLRMSTVGKPTCQLNFMRKFPSLSEGLGSQTKLKFLYGDILEEVLLFFVELAGHEVRGRQDELEYEGIKGHRDAVIDGVLIDVKSASSQGFYKFKNHLLAEDDSFGYLPQLSIYHKASKDVDPNRAGFLD
jgi:hypothetical protein